MPCLEISDNCSCFNPSYPGCSEPEDPSGAVFVSESIDTLSNNLGVYSVHRVWTAIDASGNSAFYHQTVLVTDSLNSFQPFADSNSNGICDSLENEGCIDPEACNYDSSASISSDDCDYESCTGCIFEIACNYDPPQPLMMVRVCLSA